MKQLTIFPLPVETDKQSLPAIAEALRQFEAQAIDVINWKEYPSCPNVTFYMAYDDKTLYIRYDIREKYIRAKATENNGEVWLDSCVEFFLSPESNHEYYNFEFNCIGTKLLAYRKPGEPVQHARTDVMNGIRCESNLGKQPFDEKTGDFRWSLVAAIPFSSLWKHSFDSLKGKSVQVNFYKCGDELSEPHFLSWNPVLTTSPSFHQPGFFGELAFR